MTTGKWFTPSGRSIHRERKFVDGRFVDDRPDSLETDTVRKSRPTFRSDRGRTIYGGGGITPDVIISDDTLATLESDFLRSVAPKGQALQQVLAQYALELKGSVKAADFTVPPAWTSELVRRLDAAGVKIDPKYAAVAAPLLTQELDHRVARRALGDAAAKKRDTARDRQLLKAMELLKRSGTQVDLFAAARPVAGR